MLVCCFEFLEENRSVKAGLYAVQFRGHPDLESEHMGSSSDFLLSLGCTSKMRVVAPQVTRCTVNEESAFTLEVPSGQ